MAGFQKPETRAKVRQLINEGKTFRQVAKMLRLSSPSQVSYYLDDTHAHRLRSLDKTESFYQCITCKKYFQQIFLSVEAMEKLGKIKSLEETK